MKKTTIFIIMVIALSSIVSASYLLPLNEQGKENGNAPQHSPVLGDNWDLEKVDFVHYAKPSGKGKPGSGSSDACYKLMGVKWKSYPVSYVINPTNPDELSESFVVSTFETSSETWDDATATELFSTPVVDYSAQYGVQDYVNAIDFEDYGDSRVIGVTSVWYTRRGKQIVEFDMRLNTQFNWGDASNDSSVMDLQNIAVHELGHAVGLDDIYTTTCSDVTMYGYSGYGDVSKRSLEAPDVTGLNVMYG